MKRLKKVAALIMSVVLLLVLFKGVLYRWTVRYEKGSRTPLYAVISDSLLRYTAAYDKAGALDIDEILDRSLEATSDCLYCTTAKNEMDPNKLVFSRSAHCVGYAAFFAAVCNAFLKQHGMDQEWKGEPWRGRLYFLGQNIHAWFDDPFFKDHDFVVVKNRKTDEEIGVDPTVEDYGGVKRVRVR